MGATAGGGGPLGRARTREGSWSVDAGIVHRLSRCVPPNASSVSRRTLAVSCCVAATQYPDLNKTGLSLAADHPLIRPSLHLASGISLCPVRSDRRSEVDRQLARTVVNHLNLILGRSLGLQPRGQPVGELTQTQAGDDELRGPARWRILAVSQ